MSDGFTCSTCYWIGTDPELRRSYERDEKGGAYVVYQICPDCENTELDAVAICEECENFEAEPGYDYCPQCLTEREACEAEFRRDQIAETKLLTREGM
jgi:hypothetical protein